MYVRPPCGLSSAQLMLPQLLGLQPLPRATCLHSPSWTRTRGEQRCEQLLSDPEQQPAMVDTLLTMEKPQD